MSHTVTVTRSGKQPRTNAKYRLSFTQLPGRTFGPWDFTETVRDLTVSALLDPMTARNLVLDAHANGTATATMESSS